MKQHVSWIIALVVGFALGLVSAGSLGIGGGRRSVAAPTPATAQPVRPRPVEDAQAVYRVPVDGSPALGPADALVTVVEVSDFQCPFCKRAAPTLKQLEEAYPGKLRVVFKQNPLTTIHPLALNAALAAEEARAQGGDAKFWAMHDKLFEISPALDVSALKSAAQALGLDAAKLDAALAAGKGRDRIERDQKLVTSLGATGTPCFFINGRKLAGAQPLDAFRRVVDEELKKAEALVAAGTPAAQLYDRVIEKGATARVMQGGDQAAPSAAAPAPGEPTAPRPPPPAAYRKVALRADDPARGPREAKVTLVLFSDFQCPFCGRVEPSIKQVEETYGDQVRVVWKHKPLPMHPNAIPAALAAEAAREQGKFWPMHDKLFTAQTSLTAPTFERFASEIGLDMARFKAAVAAKKGQDRITADDQLAGSIGVNGTPTMFLNCRQVVGAVPFEQLKTAMDDELAKANALLKGGKAGAGFYERACDANLALAAAAPAPAAAPAEPSPTVGVDALGLRADDPVRGNPKAPVTLVLFSDFQCPFCSRIEPTLEQVEKAYGDKVRVIWKHQPLPMHPQAIPAAEAAEAAREQGKFWQMHDKLFQNQQRLSDAVYDQYARDLGLDLARFQASRKSGRGRARIQEDQAVAGRVGASGTPTLFVNGERVVGAVPFEQVKAVIDRKLVRK